MLIDLIEILYPTIIEHATIRIPRSTTRCSYTACASAACRCLTIAGKITGSSAWYARMHKVCGKLSLVRKAGGKGGYSSL